MPRLERCVTRTGFRTHVRHAGSLVALCGSRVDLAPTWWNASGETQDCAQCVRSVSRWGWEMPDAS